MSELFIVRLKELQGKESVSAFARLLEMPQTTLNSYILGNRKPSVELIKRICLKCHVSSDWLLGLSERREPVGDVAPIALKPNRHQPTFMPRLDVLTEIASMKRRMQQLEAAAVQYLNDSASSSCCG